MKWLSDRKRTDNIWHLWFAWHPTEVNGHWVWLEFIERCDEGDMFITIWNYRML